jgi:hypothetical protein
MTTDFPVKPKLVVNMNKLLIDTNSIPNKQARPADENTTANTIFLDGLVDPSL